MCHLFGCETYRITAPPVSAVSPPTRPVGRLLRLRSKLFCLNLRLRQRLCLGFRRLAQIPQLISRPRAQVLKLSRGLAAHPRALRTPTTLCALGSNSSERRIKQQRQVRRRHHETGRHTQLHTLLHLYRTWNWPHTNQAGSRKEHEANRIRERAAARK